MSGLLILRHPSGEHSVDLDALPLRVGGAACEIRIPGLADDEVACLIGASEGALFVQPGDLDAPLLNRQPIVDSVWLRPGDLLEIAGATLRCHVEDEQLVLETSVETQGENVPSTLPAVEGEARIEATPYSRAPRRLRERRSWAMRIALGTAVALLLAAGWFLFTARPVAIQIEPEPATWSLRGGPLGLAALNLGGRSLASPGSYRVRATRPGYQELDETIEIGEAPFYQFAFTLQKLPGLLSISTAPLDSARVLIDGEEIGTTPLSRYPLPAGVHELRVSAEMHRTYTATLEIEGAGLEQSLEIALEALWADIAIDSEPAGAILWVDGVERGPTPRVEAIAEGEREIELRLSGYEPWQRGLRVRARRPTDLGVIPLERTGGVILLDSRPNGALVTLDAVFEGVTPLEISVPAGKKQELRVSKRGYRTAVRDVSLSFGQREEISIALTPKTSSLRVVASPADAALEIDGRTRQPVGRSLALSALPHTLEISQAGYETFHTTVTPRPGFAQEISVTLRSQEEAERRATPDRLESSQGQELLLVRGGRFSMGAPRRQQGRRANEVEREVEITKPFYMATTEVTNRQFREFDPSHSAGRAGTVSLDGPDHPVVGVSWQEAAAYCNWLSQRESLPLAYEDRGGLLVPASPPNDGYRLPTEAEWAWVARGAHANTGAKQKFPWGDSMIPQRSIANLGDASGSRLLGNMLPGYNDGHAATAPTGSFGADARGFFDLAGNAAEWTQDYYASDPRTGSEVEVDPRGPESGEYHVMRGSSWRDASIGPLRLSYRDYGAGKRSDVGFRIVRPLPESE